jgi:TP901 family phage tail tape measure protein
MADYTLSVDIAGDASGLARALAQAQAQVRGFGRHIGSETQVVSTAFGNIRRTVTAAGTETVAWMRKNEQQAKTLGTTFAAMGGAVAVGLGLSAKAAIDWESAWAGVVKTTDAAAEDLPALEEGLRGLTRELPASHAEIAAVAEAAGQLGVKSTDVLDFTRVMINMGEATNLTADEAATSLAQMMNIMQTAPGDVERLASTIVMLGNNGASTEKDITEMALRIAGAGKQIGLTEANVLSFANAMASVGIRAEAGGSAISRVFVMMSTAAREGGQDLAGFARVAGMSAEEFARAYRDRPAEAIDAFVQGLGRIGESGGDVFGTLSDLGIKSVEMRDVLLRLSGAGTLLADSLDDGNSAWEENSALAEEAGKRYETAQARIDIAKNSLVDFGIDIGSVVLPAIAGLADGVSSLFQWFADMPGWVQTAVTILGGLAGAAATAAGGFLLLAPRVLEIHAAFRSLAQASPTVAAGLGRVERGAGRLARAAGRAGAAGAVALLATHLLSLGQNKDWGAGGVEAATKAILDLDAASSKAGLDKLFDEATNGTWNFAEALEVVAGDSFDSKMQRFGTTLNNALGQPFLDPAAESTKQLEQMGQALASLVQGGNADLAAEKFEQIYGTLDKTKWSTEDLMRVFPDYQAALDQIGNEAKLAGVATEELGAANVGAAEDMQVATEAIEEAVKALAKQREEFDEASRSFIDIGGTYNEMYDEQMAKSEEAARKTAEDKGLEGDAWRDMVGDVRVSLDDYLAELERQAEAQANWQSNLLSLADNLSAGTIQYLQSLGPEGAALVQELTGASLRQLQKFDENVQLTMGGASSEWVRAMEVAIPLLADVTARMGEDAATALADALAAGETTVDQAAKELGYVIEQGAAGEYVVTFAADTTEAEDDVFDFAAFYRKQGAALGPVYIDADTAAADKEARDLVKRIDGASGTVTIGADDGPAALTLHNMTVAIDDAEGTVTILGNDGKAVTTLRNYKATVDHTTGTTTITGKDAKGREKVVQFKSWAGNQWSTVPITANTTEAQRKIASLAYQRITVGVDAAIGSAQRIIAGLQGGATGGKVGRIAGYASGGRLPGSPPSDPTRDNLLAITDAGVPIAVRSREWIINQGASDYYGDRAMSAINDRRVPYSVLAGYATGGQPQPAPAPVMRQGAQTVVVRPVVSLAGARLTLEVEGRQMEAYVKDTANAVVDDRNADDDRTADYARR